LPALGPIDIIVIAACFVTVPGLLPGRRDMTAWIARPVPEPPLFSRTLARVYCPGRL
jgi:hypothetical protein